MSLVTYNGVVLPYPMHSQFSQEAVKDESGTDWMYLKFDIAVQCVVSSDYMRLLCPIWRVYVIPTPPPRS
jgi:hypothetical protein